MKWTPIPTGGHKYIYGLFYLHIFLSSLDTVAAAVRIRLSRSPKTRLTQYCAGGKIEKNEMGGACAAYGGGERCAQGSGWET